ncbi:MAG: response regulator [Leptospiraceae bacterium]|nr:response regulator [Leptospiraceae bacterium]MCP5497905.1 response regulator [Leptospiraceae bacterium]
MKKILVIDDQEAIVYQVAYILNQNGYQIIEAEDGEKGLQLAKTENPDLIICDIMMPKVDGYAVFQELKKDPKTENIPFLFLTAKGAKEDIRIGMNLGAEDYLSKPIDLGELVQAVATQLKKKEINDKISEIRLKEIKTNLNQTLPEGLNTPLEKILEIANQLKLNLKNLQESSIQELLDKLHSSGEILHKRVENFIIFAHLEFIQKSPEKIVELHQKTLENPKDIIENMVLKKAISENREKDIDLKVENAKLKISSMYFMKVLDEVIENAYKYSSRNTPIEVLSFVDSDRYILSMQNISNTPEGLISVTNLQNKEQIEHLKNGLGLEIVKKILQLHGGFFTIKVNNENVVKINFTLPISS